MSKNRTLSCAKNGANEDQYAKSALSLVKSDD